MDKYYHYWRFFCDNTFAREDKLQFFDDGSFAITTRNRKVSLYSNKAELLGCYENAFALDNGCVCERYGENIIIHNSMGEQYYISCPAHVRMIKPLTNALTFILKLEDEIQATSELYFITPQRKDMRHISFKEDIIVENVSPFGLIVYKTVSGRKLLDANQKEIPLSEFQRIEFLPDGAYIVYFLDMDAGCALYNARNERLLASSQNFGIQPLGDKVLYERALIVCPETGRFLKEYANEKVVYDDMLFYEYRIEENGFGKNPSYLWPGSQMHRSLTSALGSLLYYWHDGHFYVAPQISPVAELEFDKQLAFDKLQGQDESFAWQHYLMRIGEIIP